MHYPLVFIFLLSAFLQNAETSQVQAAVDYKAAAQKFYEPGLVHKIEIKASQWDELRNQSPMGGRCVWGFLGSQYDWFEFEEIKIDGVALANIGVKKKSWCNSESTEKPGLNIKFDKYIKANEKEALRFWGVDGLTLNNSLQDRSYLRQCLAYRLFERAGIISPQCNFAQLVVNGQDLGMYISIEPMKKRFFKQRYGEPLGNLYEVSGEAFKTWALPRFAASQEGWKDESLDDLKQLFAALKNDNSEDLEELGAIVDLEQFISYWAMEIILSHFDGLTFGSNNSHIYFGKDGKMRMVPWGTDQILARPGPLETQEIYQNELLSQKLYANKIYRERLHLQIEAHVKAIWNEESLKLEVDQLASQLSPFIKDQNSFKYHVKALKERIQMRRQEMRKFISLDAGQPTPEPLPIVEVPVAPIVNANFPVCTRNGFKDKSSEFVWFDGASGWGYMKLEKGEGFSCRNSAKAQSSSLPVCKEACPTQAQSGDWGWCAGTDGFSCTK